MHKGHGAWTKTKLREKALKGQHCWPFSIYSSVLTLPPSALPHGVAIKNYPESVNQTIQIADSLAPLAWVAYARQRIPPPE